MYEKINRYEQDDLSDDMEMLKNEPFEDNIETQMNNFNKDDLLNDDAKNSQTMYNKYDDMEMKTEKDTKAENTHLNKEKPLEYDIKGKLNELNHDEDNYHINKNQRLEKNADSQISNFNPHKVDKNQQRSNDQPTGDNRKPRPNQVNKHQSTTSSSTTAGFKTPLKMNHRMIRPWGNANHYNYHDQNDIKNEKYLTSEIIRPHTQHNLNNMVHFDDSMDSIDSDMTWDDEGIEEDDSKMMRDSYADRFEYEQPYANINDDMNGGYHDSYEGNMGTGGTYRDTEWMSGTMGSTHRSTGNGMSMYKDSKAYLKQTEDTTEDNTGYIDAALLGHSHDLHGLEGINGLSSYGGVGLPLQEYADEMGEIRGLHHKTSHKKEKSTIEGHTTTRKEVKHKKIQQ